MDICKNHIYIASFFIFLIGMELFIGLAVALDPIKTLMLVIGFIGAVVIFISPWCGLLGIAVLLSFQNEVFSLISIGKSQLRLFEIVSLLFFASWLVHSLFIDRKNPFIRTGLELPLFCFFSWCMLSVLWTGNIGGYLSKSIQLCFGILFIYGPVYWMQTRQHFIVIIKSWCAVGFAAATWGLIECQFLGFFRAMSLDTEAINFAEHLNYPIILMMVLIKLEERERIRLLLLGIFVVMVLGHISTGGRAAFLSLLAGLVFFISPSVWKFSFWKRFIPLIILFGGVILFTNIPELLMSRFMNIFDQDMTDHGMVFRFYVWGGVMSLIVANPLTGVGLGGLERLLPDLTMESEKVNVIAQNLYLEIGAALGVIGLVLFFWFVFRITTVLWKIMRSNRISREWMIILYGLAGCLLTKLTSFTYGVFVEDEFFWFILGLTMAAVRCATEKTENTREIFSK